MIGSGTVVPGCGVVYKRVVPAFAFIVTSVFILQTTALLGEMSLINACGYCLQPTNGSQFHRGCFRLAYEDVLRRRELDAEVESQRLRCEEEILEEQEEELQRVRSLTPLSMPEYYIQAAAEHDEEFRKVVVQFKDIPEGLRGYMCEASFDDGEVSVDRYLNGSVSLMMYRVMKSQFPIIVREPVINMVYELYFDLETRWAVHEHCIPPEDLIMYTPGCIKICNWSSADLCDYIACNLELFFCQYCEYSMVQNFCNWCPKLCGDAITALGQKHPIITVSNNVAKDTVFELSVKFDAMCNY